VRIALASDWFLPRIGGIELHLRDLAGRLAGAGHEVMVITSALDSGPAPPDDSYATWSPGSGSRSPVRVHRLTAARLPVAGVVRSPSVMKEIDHLLSVFDVEIMHAHISIVSPVAYGAAWAARRRAIPTVVTFHSVIPGLETMLRVLNGITRLSEWGVVPTAVSRRVASAVAPVAARGAGILTLPNGIDPAEWRATPGVVRVPVPGKLRLVSAMRLTNKKRPAALVRMLRRVRTLLAGECDVTLKIAGEGPARRSLETLIDNLNIGNSVELVGHMRREQLRQLYATADLFVLPTRLEAFGLAALEARAAGLPVAAMAGSGVEDFITHGREGWLAADDLDLARIVAGAARAREALARIAEHNRRVPPPNAWSEVMPHHIGIYESAIAAELRS
jgi:glycosyltransferase involved in cell wall biosynthesis